VELLVSWRGHANGSVFPRRRPESPAKIWLEASPAEELSGEPLPDSAPITKLKPKTELIEISIDSLDASLAEDLAPRSNKNKGSLRRRRRTGEVFWVTSADLVFFFTLFSAQLSRDPARNRKKKKKKRDLKNQTTKKQSLFPAGICRFTSAVKPGMGGGASWHGQDRRMHRSGQRRVHICDGDAQSCVMELKESFLTQSCVTIVWYSLAWSAWNSCVFWILVYLAFIGTRNSNTLDGA
jgi:hypothetical protein